MKKVVEAKSLYNDRNSWKYGIEATLQDRACLVVNTEKVCYTTKDYKANILAEN